MTREDATDTLASVRDTLRVSTDRRAAGTRRRLSDAVRSLASTGAEITATSVADAAGISRATFYTHFSGIDDLALHLQEQAFHVIADSTRADAEALDSSIMERSQRALIEHYATYRPLYARVFAIAVPRGAESRVVELMRAGILAHIAAAAQPPADVDPAIASRYIAHAAVGLIVDWVLGEITATEEELAHHLTQLMPRWMHTRIPPSVGDAAGHASEGDQS